MKIVFTIIRKLLVLGVVLFISLAIALLASYTMGGTATMMGFSASVIAIISFAMIMMISSLIGDAVFFKVDQGRQWINLAMIVVPNSLFVYFYVLNGGQFLQLPEFQTVGNILLFGSVVLGLLFWGLDEVSRKLMQKWMRKSQEVQAVAEEKRSE
jgi:hypothetical protein